MEKPACGHEMLREFALTLWRAFPDIRYEPPQETFPSSDRTKLVHKFIMEGTMIGPLQPGFAPTGRKFSMDGLEMIEFRNSKIYQCITRIDGIDVAQQIGLLPPRLRAIKTERARQIQQVGKIRNICILILFRNKQTAFEKLIAVGLSRINVLWA
jgi:predicted ester cyclase